jgi:hypothetical protein
MLCTMTKKGRWIRAIVGLAVIGAGVYYQSWWGALGLLLIASAAAGFCPMEKLCRPGGSEKGSCCDHDHGKEEKGGH